MTATMQYYFPPHLKVALDIEFYRYAVEFYAVLTRA